MKLSSILWPPPPASTTRKPLRKSLCTRLKVCQSRLPPPAALAHEIPHPPRKRPSRPGFPPRTLQKPRRSASGCCVTMQYPRVQLPTNNALSKNPLPMVELCAGTSLSLSQLPTSIRSPTLPAKSARAAPTRDRVSPAGKSNAAIIIRGKTCRAAQVGSSKSEKQPGAMFEISGTDINSLGDADLRSLITRLAMAELRANGHPLSSVTAGGHQDAADGGLDVRIECPTDMSSPDFVPRRSTGFQAKTSSMPVAAILKEMRPHNVLRDVIRGLADASGAYVIVSAQGSVADKPLADRRKAMRDALHDYPNGAQLHTDFYDRDRLAIWINKYPGIAAWVRVRIGRPLSGWSSIGDWDGGAVALKPYLFNDKACLIDASSRDRRAPHDHGRHKAAP